MLHPDQLPDPEALRLLAELHRTRSLGVAAERLGCSLSKASRMLGTLRKLFDDELFVRCDHCMHPTKGMQALAPKIERILGAYAALSEGDCFLPQRLERTYNIGGLDNALVAYVLPVLSDLAAAAPGVALNFHPLGRDFASDLRAGRLDLAIYATENEFPGILKRPLVEDMFVFVAHDEHALARRLREGGVVTSDEASAAASIRTTVPMRSPDETPHAYCINHLPESTGGSCNATKLWTPFFSTIPIALAETRGVALMPCRVAERLAKHFPVTILGAPARARPFLPYVFRAEHGQGDESLSWFENLLVQKVRKSAADLRTVPLLP